MIKIPARYSKVEFTHVPENIRGFLPKVDQEGQSVYIHGAVGTGKTHIAYAIAKQHDQATQWTKFWNVTELLFEIREDFKRSPEEKRGRADSLLDFTGLLILDDIGAEKPTDFVAETLYMIINNRYNHKFPTVFTSNLHLAELAERIGDRTASRIAEMSRIFELSGKDRRLNNL
jgi:DNA replication protein DnaC